MTKKKSTAATPVFAGKVRCPCCGDTRMLETTDESLLRNPPRCFTCHMNNRPIPEILGPDKK